MRSVVGNDEKEFGGAGFAFEVTGDIDRLLSDESARLHVFGVHEEHAAFVLNAAIAVIVAVDGRVELVVTTKGL